MSAFEEIYRATSDYIYTVAVNITGNRADAEEVTQDVFLKVFRRLKDFHFRSSFKTWIYRITLNSAISRLRKRAKWRSRESEYSDSIAHKSGRNTTREAVDREYNELRVRSMLEMLNPDQRACIVLRGIEGLSYREIAEVLSININTVRSRLRRARGILVARHRKEAKKK